MKPSLTSVEGEKIPALPFNDPVLWSHACGEKTYRTVKLQSNSLVHY